MITQLKKCIFCLFILLTGCATVPTKNLVPPLAPQQITDVAILLPTKSNYHTAAASFRDGFLQAYYNDQQRNPKLNIRFYDTSTQSINSVYEKALRSNAQIIIGPMTKNHVAVLADRSSVNIPVIALNYTNPDHSLPNYFYEFGFSQELQAAQVAMQASQQNLKRALIIAPNTSWGKSIVNEFINTWQSRGGIISDQFNYDPSKNLNQSIKQFLGIQQSNAIAKQIQKALNKKLVFTPQRRIDFDMIFLVATPDWARQIVPLLRYYFVDSIPIYSTALIHPYPASATYYHDIEGVIFPEMNAITTPKFYPLQPNNRKASSEVFQNSYRFFALGVDSYTIMKNLANLPTQPGSGLNGYSGSLYLWRNHYILQQLKWVKISDGQMQLLG